MMGDSLDEFEIALALHAQKLAEVQRPHPSPPLGPKSSSSSGEGVGKMTGLTSSSSCCSIMLHKQSSDVWQIPQESPPGVGVGSCSAMALTARCNAANGAVGVGRDWTASFCWQGQSGSGFGQIGQSIVARRSVGFGTSVGSDIESGEEW